MTQHIFSLLLVITLLFHPIGLLASNENLHSKFLDFQKGTPFTATDMDTLSKSTPILNQDLFDINVILSGNMAKTNFGFEFEQSCLAN